MNMKNLTQEKFDQILKEYFEIAFPKMNIEPDIIPVNHVEKQLRVMSHAEFRFGIKGWGHTKLIFERNGNIEINENGDKFNREQKKILRNLKNWVDGINLLEK